MHDDKLLFCQLKFGTPEQRESVELRRRVLRKPLGLDFSPQELAAEKEQFHLAVLEQGKVCGVALLVVLSSRSAKVRQVALDLPWQGRGLGRRLMEFVESFALQKGIQILELHSREAVVPFYEKLGYKKVGNRFVEVGIPHWKMTKDLGV